ncbi:MAG: signal recognition particle protein [Deltaproteobacteria bacterium GWC2_42_11]|nr:MAG: signal recognition particle protein [Deltaproteobacteria bacterium GWC2_42_11]
MFENISDRLGVIFKRLKGYGRLTEANIQEALRDVRMALLEADVNFKVVREFIDRIKTKAVGREVLESLTPGQQFIKVVNDELTSILGGLPADLRFGSKPPAVIMVVGLQGSGKTTTAAKLARYLKGKGRSPYLVPADVYRPAAILQLRRLADEIKMDVFADDVFKTPQEICREAMRVAGVMGHDTLIVDTAGRLHIDEALMCELKELKGILKPCEMLFVADAMTGQDAVNTAGGFDRELDITGIILTKLDGDARGGAALSMAAVTGKPIKFVGIGEKVDAIEPFYPDRMAGRILGMGDVLTLIEKAHEAVDVKKAKEMEEKLRKDSFTLEDFREQLHQIKKMGSIENILSMMPGFKELQKSHGVNPDPKDLIKIEAIINSMTKEERRKPDVLNGSRRKRIAKGSGTTVQDVNKLIKQYLQIKQMMKVFARSGSRAMFGRTLNAFRGFMPS